MMVNGLYFLCCEKSAPSTGEVDPVFGDVCRRCVGVAKAIFAGVGLLVSIPVWHGFLCGRGTSV
jgi:hypothetical protein